MCVCVFFIVFFNARNRFSECTSGLPEVGEPPCQWFESESCVGDGEAFVSFGSGWLQAAAPSEHRVWFGPPPPLL